MSRRTFYLFGTANNTGSASVYDDILSTQRIRFHFCDTPADLPNAGVNENDIAIVISNCKFKFVKNGAWTDIKAAKELVAEPIEAEPIEGEIG